MMLSINLETATNEELNAAQLLISDELGRRQTLAEAARTIHRLTVAYQDAAVRNETD